MTAPKSSIMLDGGDVQCSCAFRAVTLQVVVAYLSTSEANTHVVSFANRDILLLLVTGSTITIFHDQQHSSVLAPPLDIHESSSM